MIPKYIWEFVQTWEGGSTVSNDADDSGGYTKYGISQVHNPLVNVAELDEDKAQAIFYTRYWLGAHCDLLPEYMQLMQFNCSVNCGPTTAIKILQKTLGARGDGRFGPLSRRKLNTYNSSPRVFVGWYATHQALHYVGIVLFRRSQEKWLKGWLRRTYDAVFVTGATFGEKYGKT